MSLSLQHVSMFILAGAAFGCGGVESELDGNGDVQVDQVATDKNGLYVPILVNGKWHAIVDSFYEACSGPTLAIAAAPGVTNAKNYIQRGVSTIVPYYWWSTNGWWRWWCGGSAERAECSGPRHPTAVEKLRILWDTDSPSIDIQCLTQCGDGSSSAACYSM